MEKARPLIEGPVTAEPGNWRFLINLSVLREAEGRIDDAIGSARLAAAAGPDRFETWGRLGELCGKAGDLKGAASALEKAVALNPDHPGMTLLLAGAAYEIGKYELSESALHKFETIAPGRREALRLRTHLARKQERPDDFMQAARRWLEADPGSEEARVALAFGHAQRDDFHTAVEVYRPLVVAEPNNADHAATFARYLVWTRDFAGAEQYYGRALETRPDHAGAAAGLARLTLYKGKFGEAGELARRAIASEPDNVEAYAQLTLASDSNLPDDDLARLEALARSTEIDADRRAIAWFTIGNVYHRRRDPDRAFDAWTRANALKNAIAAQSEAWSYDRAATEKLVDRLIASFHSFPASTGTTARAGPGPLFIVGMPRAGTTLLDSALSGHASISSGGELPAMPSLLTSFFEWADGANWQGGPIPASILQQIRDSYLRQYADYGISPASFITDKQPMNFLSVGLIRYLFPDAPLIHIRRSPLETGFSIFRNNFTKSWPFSTALADIGHYYGQYVRMMDHWHRVLGDGLASVQYERLVVDFEGELRRLLTCAGLEWDPNCLSYFQRDSIVTTLSSVQVRKPPSKSLMSSTGPYLAALQPLKEALENAGVDIPGAGELIDS